MTVRPPPLPAPPAPPVLPAARLPRRFWLALAGLLLLALIVRGVALDWGIAGEAPAPWPPGQYRPAYNFDEDTYLQLLTHFHPTAGQWDIGDYHWGTLQFYMIAGALQVGQWTGVLPTPWEPPFQAGDLAVDQRLYSVARLVSVLAGLGAVLAVVGLGATLGGWAVGLMAGAIYALLPLAVVGAHYLTNDLLMSALVAGAVWAAVWAVQRGRLAGLVVAGLLLGLATATKYSGLSAAPALLFAQFALWRLTRSAPRPPAGWQIGGLPLLALAAGLVLGEPALLLAPTQVLGGLQLMTTGNAPDLSEGVMRPVRVLGWQVVEMARLALTPPVALLALAGLLTLLLGRRDNLSEQQRLMGWVVLTAVEGLLLGVALNRVPMLRYTQPLLPLLAVLAALAWGRVRRPAWRGLVGGLALGGAGLMTAGQLSLLAGPHPVDEMAVWLQPRLQPGQQIAQVWPEYPVLDNARYQLIQIIPWAPDLAPAARPDYILLNDMLLAPLPPQVAARVAAEYQEVARFSARPHVGPFAWDEGGTPHDWKYSHPTLIVYARRDLGTGIRPLPPGK